MKAVVNTAGGVIKTEAGIGALWKKITGEAKRVRGTASVPSVS